MRIRITRRCSDVIDGVSLNVFKPGFIYDVDASLATYLMVQGCAQGVADCKPARVIPLDDLSTKMREAMRRAESRGPKR